MLRPRCRGRNHRGAGFLKARWEQDNVEDAIYIVVGNPGEIAYYDIYPKEATVLGLGDSIRLYAVARDALGNIVQGNPIWVPGGVGSLSSAGLYTAPATNMGPAAIIRVVDRDHPGVTGEKIIKDGVIRATDLRQIKAAPDDAGLMTYDPAFMNTAACRSRITFIDGDQGILLYRGYPIEQLAEHSDYLETAHLLLHGELPGANGLDAWSREVMHHTMLHENIKKFMEGFRYDAHPMGIFLSTVGCLSTLNPDSKQIFDKGSRLLQTKRLIAKVPSIAAYAYRHSIGRHYNHPDNELTFAGNFLNMLFKMTELKYQPNPVLERALDVLFILHADHE